MRHSDLKRSHQARQRGETTTGMIVVVGMAAVFLVTAAKEYQQALAHPPVSRGTGALEVSTVLDAPRPR